LLNVWNSRERILDWVLLYIYFTRKRVLLQMCLGQSQCTYTELIANIETKTLEELLTYNYGVRELLVFVINVSHSSNKIKSNGDSAR
jgi:hypothetical protein